MSFASEKTVRPGFSAVTPYVIVEKVTEMVEFMKQAFGAEETLRTTGSGGGFHIEVRLDDSMLMIGGGGQWTGPSMPTSLNYFVDDVDAAYQRALASGATSFHAPVDQPYGVREAGVTDIAGNHWYISTPWKGTDGLIAGMGSVVAYLHPKGADGLIDFLKRAFDAEEVEIFHEPTDGPVVHAKVRVFGSIVEMGEANGQYMPMPTAFFLYVADSVYWFERAIQAGATVVYPMADQPYGKGGGLEDPHGNHWYIYTHKQ